MRTLLDRITILNPTAFGKEADVLVKSVRAHLVYLLNTHQGTLFCFPNYGLPDLKMAYIKLPDSMHYFCRELVVMIEKYEPRLSAVKVRRFFQHEATRVLTVELSAWLLDIKALNFSAHFNQQQKVVVTH